VLFLSLSCSLLLSTYEKKNCLVIFRHSLCMVAIAKRLPFRTTPKWSLIGFYVCTPSIRSYKKIKRYFDHYLFLGARTSFTETKKFQRARWRINEMLSTTLYACMHAYSRLFLALVKLTNHTSFLLRYMQKKKHFGFAVNE
jgi:hypothetical protein